MSGRPDVEGRLLSSIGQGLLMRVLLDYTASPRYRDAARAPRAALGCDLSSVLTRSELNMLHHYSHPVYFCIALRSPQVQRTRTPAARPWRFRTKGCAEFPFLELSHLHSCLHRSARALLNVGWTWNRGRRNRQQASGCLQCGGILSRSHRLAPDMRARQPE